MNKPTKLLLGVVTVLPLIYVTLFFLGQMQAFYMMLFTDSGDPLLYRWVGFHSLFRIHLLAMVWNVSLIGFYMVKMARNDCLKNEMKAVWAVAIVMGSVFSMPIYWYQNVWRERKTPFDAV